MVVGLTVKVAEPFTCRNEVELERGMTGEVESIDKSGHAVIFFGKRVRVRLENFYSREIVRGLLRFALRACSPKHWVQSHWNISRLRTLPLPLGVIIISEPLYQAPPGGIGSL